MRIAKTKKRKQRVINRVWSRRVKSLIHHGFGETLFPTVILTSEALGAAL